MVTEKLLGGTEPLALLFQIPLGMNSARIPLMFQDARALGGAKPGPEKTPRIIKI